MGPAVHSKEDTMHCDSSLVGLEMRPSYLLLTHINGPAGLSRTAANVTNVSTARAHGHQMFYDT